MEELYNVVEAYTESESCESLKMCHHIQFITKAFEIENNTNLSECDKNIIHDGIEKRIAELDNYLPGL